MNKKTQTGTRHNKKVKKNEDVIISFSVYGRYTILREDYLFTVQEVSLDPVFLLIFLAETR